ncbi:MAG: FkbM family methyltransferase [Phycisphaera sp.]|nr:FkbM family methyltransferase [Phycisphaera sp.]
MGLVSAIVESSVRGCAALARTSRCSLVLCEWARNRRPRHKWHNIYNTPVGKLELDTATYPDLCMAYGFYKVEVSRFIRRTLHKGDHFVDGGANLGYFTLMAAKAVGPTGRVDAFEPEPTLRARLLANLQVNGPFPQVKVHDTALSDHEGQTHIHLMPNQGSINHGCSSIFDRSARAVQTTVAQTVTLGKVLRGVYPRLVKLDIEGAEPVAIEGMTPLLTSATPPILIVDHHVAVAKAAGYSPRAWIDTLQRIQPRYRLYVLRRGLKKLDPKGKAVDRLEHADILARCE